MPLPLSGLLVVSLEQAVAAPMCTCRLADAGARVIKVERPEGDFARYYDKLAVRTPKRPSPPPSQPKSDISDFGQSIEWPNSGRPEFGCKRGEGAHRASGEEEDGESAYFVWLNRGKESLVLDLVREDDKALLAAILAKADVFVQNLKPGAVAKLGFALEELRRAHPRLVICSISGYGEDGPYAREWRVLAEKVLDDKALAADPAFATNVERVKRRAETDARVAAGFAATDEAALTKKLAGADIAFARVNTTADLAVHPQLRRIEIATPSGVVSYPAPPARTDAAPRRYGAVPALGEHTAKIWAEFMPHAPRSRA
jgi:crotonobetainyl-CoA:carnitine CoA-transferase CaiB-like acyl-CoA transferase